MRPTRTAPLIALALTVAALGWALLSGWSGSGRELPPASWATPVVLVALAGAVIIAAWPVRRWQRGDRDHIFDPLRAARTVVLAKAAQCTGSLLSGWYTAQILALLSTITVDARRSLAIRIAVSLVAALVVWVAGWLVERWCRITGDGDARDDSRGSRPPTTSPA
ncbi:MAG: DUF3180 domain-containing protein [Actinomycetota bacterium]